MPFLADTETLVADGIITKAQAREIESRSRASMVTLAINALLCTGILAATLGLVAFLADPVAVAVFGFLAMGVGLIILTRGSALYRIFGNATALIGAGMLMAGAGVELMDNYPAKAAVVMGVGGAVVAVLAMVLYLRGRYQTRVAAAAILLMGVALHLTGLFYGLDAHLVAGWAARGALAYTFVLILGTGMLLDLRLISAMAIVPFAQLLGAGGALSGDLYVLISPTPTLTILQMAALCAVCLVGQSWASPRLSRQFGILGAMGFLSANVSLLSGSLFGDEMGMVSDRGVAGFVISANVYAAVWAILLIGIAIWAASANRRGLFNITMVFAAIHAFTQLFQSFGDQPLAWVVGGLAAVPLAWGMWRMNERLRAVG